MRRSAQHQGLCSLPVPPMIQTPTSATLADQVERLSASVIGLGALGGQGGCLRGGSGVLWRPDVAVGSASVLRRAGRVAVILPSGEQVEGELRGVDAGTDLAAVQFAAGAMPVAERSAGAVPLRVGEAVFAVGRGASGLTQASFGHIGAVAGAWRSWRGGLIDGLIRLDGGLYPDFAGAPVADASGQLIGVASDALSRHHGVVLPLGTIDRVLDALLAHGSVRQGYLGIAAQAVRATLDGQPVEGLLLSSVAEDGPAARAGLQVGDVIVTLAGEPAGSLDSLRGRLQVGARLAILVSRGGQRHELSVEVGERSAGCH